MKYLLVFLAVFGISNCALLPPQSGFRPSKLIQQRLAVKDGELADIIKLIEGLVREAIEAVGNDFLEITLWLYQEWEALKPYVDKFNGAVKALADQTLADLQNLGEQVGQDVVAFIGSHAQDIHQIYELIQDAVEKLNKQDAAGVEADIKKMIPLIQSILNDFGNEVKADIPKFIQWLENEQTVLAPLVKAVFQAGAALAKELFNEVSAANDKIAQKILDFIKAHQQEILALWKDVAVILKNFGIKVTVPSDLTPAINDLTTLIGQVKTLITDFQPLVDAEVQNFINWIKQEHQKLQPAINIISGAIKGFIQSSLDEIQKVIKESLDDLGAFLEQHDKEIHDLFQQIITTVNDFLNGNTAQGETDLKKAEQLLDNLLLEAKAVVQKRVQEFLDWVKQEWQTIKPMIPLAVNLVKGVLKDAVAEIGKESQDLLSKVEAFVSNHKDLVQQFQATVQKFLKDLGIGQ